ncbi:MAG TPA: hypothetical protein PLE30_10425 [Candidatus Kapabacteria bacterium]|nr:hypothetical protein [Candidatus Kapabacteria bacterium]
MAMEINNVLESQLIDNINKSQESSVNTQIQQKILKDAVSGETSPQQQAMQILISTPNLNQTQQTAQQQIKQGYVDVKI